MKIKPLASAAEAPGRVLPAPEDEAEIARLYLMYREQFIAFVTRYFGCGATTAADIYQESFLAMFQNLKEGRIAPQSASLKTYLFQIGRFKALNLSRQRQGRPEVDLYGIGDMEAAQSEVRMRLREIAREEVAAMQEPCNSVLSLYYWEHMGMAEIARRMNYKNERVAINRKSLCLKKLRELISGRLKKEELDYYDNE